MSKIDELFYDFNICAMIDLNVGDGKTAMVAIRRNASLVGITYNDYHKEQLHMRLEAEVFKEMQNPESPLYEAALVSLLGNNKKRKGTAKASVIK